MRKNSLLALCFLTFLMMLVLPVSAANNSPRFRANGRVLSYYLPPGETPSSIVVNGNWNVKIEGYDVFDPRARVDFNLFYREMNLIPEQEGGAPAGSVDQFRITLVQADIFRYGAGGCIIVGRFNVDKLAWLPEGSTPPIDHKYNFADVYGILIITPTGFQFDAGPWHLLGSTISMTMK